MIVLFYDLETTGLDKHKDRMIEVGLCLYSTGQDKILESAGFLVKSDGVQVSQKITGITGITQAAVDRYGYDPVEAFEDILSFAERADAIATHNGRRFDLPFSRNTACRLGLVFPNKLEIDTMTDIPGVDGEKLVTMCAQCPRPFINPNQHSAEDDAKSVLGLMRAYGVDSVIEWAKKPLIAIRSHQNQSRNQDAKDLKFRWCSGLKLWWKAVREEEIEALAKTAPFDISRIGKEISLEQLSD